MQRLRTTDLSLFNFQVLQTHGVTTLMEIHVLKRWKAGRTRRDQVGPFQPMRADADLNSRPQRWRTHLCICAIIASGLHLHFKVVHLLHQLIAPNSEIPTQLTTLKWWKPSIAMSMLKQVIPMISTTSLSITAGTTPI